MLSSRKRVTLIDTTWKVIKEGLKVTNIPRKDELIYLSEFEHYFNVVNVIHKFEGKQGIFIIVEKHE